MGTRFQHCIGVYHLAEVFIERLERMQPELNITKEEKLCICIAGLMHDVGHITQGHLYPLYVRYCNSKVLVEHEVMSIYIFQMILEKYDLMKEFAKYNLDKKVRVISPGHVVGSASHLRDHFGRQEEGSEGLEVGRSAGQRIPPANRGKREVSMQLCL